MLGVQAISLVGNKNKELFTISIGYLKTGNVLSLALLSSRGWFVLSAVSVLFANASLCPGTCCLICMKHAACLKVTDVNKKGKYSMEISAVFCLSCWKQ